MLQLAVNIILSNPNSERKRHSGSPPSNLSRIVLALFLWIIGHQYFSLRTNQPSAISQQYFSLRTNQHQLPTTSQPNKLSHARLSHALNRMHIHTPARVVTDRVSHERWPKCKQGMESTCQYDPTVHTVISCPYAG
jgi:hypothetical protein